MTWKPDPTTTTSTTTTTVPETTVPPTTIPETGVTVPDTTVPDICTGGIPCETVPPGVPDTTTPSDICTGSIPCDPPATIQTGCAPGEFPQGPTGDEPCGPTDLCSGDGVTRNWSLQPCADLEHTTGATTTVATVEAPPMLPATGGETGWIALTGTVMILVGISLVSAVKGRRA
jgi:hypothetical protein